MNKKRVFVIACFFVAVLFLLHEIFLNFYNNLSFARVILKFLMSFIPFGLAFLGWKSDKNKVNFFIMLGLFVCCIADAVINIVLIVGGILYLAGHLLFMRAFLSIKKPVLIQYLCWAFFAILVSVFLYFVHDADPKLKIFAVIYTLFMTAMVSFSFCATKRLFIGGVIFGLSDVLLMINMATGASDGVAHIFSLGIYYVGVLLMANEIYVAEK